MTVRNKKLKDLAAYLFAGVILVLTIFIWRIVDRSVKKDADKYFDDRVEESVSIIETRMGNYIDALYSLKGLFVASENVTRAEWTEFLDQLRLDERYPGFLSFGLTRFVKKSEKESFEKRVRGEGYPGFRVTPAGAREEYFVVDYIYPFIGNETLFGLDRGVQPIRRKAIERARDTGAVFVTEKIEITASHNEPGFMIFLPVYKNTAQAHSVEGRRKSFFGLIAVRFTFDRLMRGVFKNRFSQELDFEMYEGGDIASDIPVKEISLDNKAVLYDNDGVNRGRAWNPALGGYSRMIPMDFAGHRWFLFFTLRPGAKLAPVSNLPLVMLAGGIIIAIVIFLLISSLSGAEKRAVSLAEKMTSDIRTKNIKLEEMSGEIARNNRRLEGLLRISRHKDDSSKDLLDFALEEALQATDSKIGYIYLYNEKTREFILNSWSKEVMKECLVMDKQTLYQLHKTGIWGEAVRQRIPIIVNDFESAHPLMKGYPEGHVKLKSFLTTPVFDGPEIVAVIGVANKEAGYNSADTNELILIMDTAWKLTKSRIADERIREALGLKAMFISNVSHELRTPLTSIKEGIGIVLDGIAGSINPEQHEFLELAKRNVDRLHRLINDLLDFSKIDSGKVELLVKKNNLNGVIEEVVKAQKNVAAKKGLYLNMELAAGLEEFEFDRDRIVQVLNNLLNNAIKFTESGGVAVKSVFLETDQTVSVRVEDTGPGILKEDIQKLFQEFGQLSGKDYRKPGSTGLGLAISKQIIEKHGGKIWVESEYGLGSVFIFSLPIKRERI